MATVVLEYDAQNQIAIKTLNYILSLDVFKKVENNNPFAESDDDIRKGRVYSAKNADDLIKNVSNSMYSIKYTNKFKKDVKRCKRQRLDLDLLRDVINILAETGTLPPKYKPHPLEGNHKNRMECHIQPDWLLV